MDEKFTQEKQALEARHKAMERALQDLSEFKNYEADYGKINKLINVINNFAALMAACELMAERIAKDENRTKEEVLAKVYAQIEEQA